MRRIAFEQLQEIAARRFSRAELDAVIESRFRELSFPPAMEEAFRAYDAIEFAGFRRIAVSAIVLAYMGASATRLIVYPHAETMVTVAQFGLILPALIALIAFGRRSFVMAHFKNLFAWITFGAISILFLRYEIGELATPYLLPAIFCVVFPVLFGLRLLGFRRACLLSGIVVTLYYIALFVVPELPSEINIASETIVVSSLVINGVMGYLIEHRQRENFLINRRLRAIEAEATDAQIAAENANAAKSIFLATMNHELRTPLTVIIGYNELVKAEVQDRNLDFLADVNKVHVAAQHLLGLINNIIDFSKIEAGRMEIERREFPVANMVAELQALVDPLVARNRNRFQADCPANAGAMVSDETKIRQILLNLLSNAAKFTEGGDIVLRIRRIGDAKGSGIEFTISDSGIGIAEEHLKRIFAPFTQADASTTRKYGGTGLGLSITKRLVELLGGQIEVASRLGQGTTFVVTLPAIYMGRAGGQDMLAPAVRANPAVTEGRP